MATTAQAQTELPQSHLSGQWSLGKRTAFRFVFLYFVLYNFPFPIGWIPGTDGLYQTYSSMLHTVIPWIGKHFLNLNKPITVFTNGSGDTTYDYVLALCFLTLAVSGTLLWSWLDRRRTNYATLNAGFRVGIRMLLAGTMMLFGSVKVFQVQFPVVSFSKMLESYGNSSPMGLLWTFMGASPGYAAFTGVVEMLGGVLLIFPRLTTFGALISAAAMANVFALNLAYDVPVKLYSFHVLLMAMILIAPELRRLADVFLFNRPAAAAGYPPLFVRAASRRAFMIAQLAFCLYIFSNANYQAYKVDGRFAPKPPHYGIWSVEEFTVNGQSRPPLLSDPVRWRRLVFDDFDYLTVESMDGQLQRLRLEQGNDHTINLTQASGGPWSAKLRAEELSPEIVRLNGLMDGQQLQIKLRKEQPSFLLLTRGFHWISEGPFNK
jgi:hypothetical protein